MTDKKRIKDLDNLITTNPVEISQFNRQAAINLKNSESKKKFYASEAGLKEKKLRSKRTKKYWASENGLAKKERLRAKYKGVKKSKS